MNKEERDFIRWIIQNAQTESELFRAAEAAEGLRHSVRIETVMREEEPHRKAAV